MSVEIYRLSQRMVLMVEARTRRQAALVWYKSKQVNDSVYHLQSNGLVERERDVVCNSLPTYTMVQRWRFRWICFIRRRPYGGHEFELGVGGGMHFNQYAKRLLNG